MIKIRKGVFETNSSSTHCLVWHNTDKDSTVYIDFNHYVIEAGYYGRTSEKPLFSIEERLGYFWTAILCNARNLNDSDQLDLNQVYHWKNKLNQFFPDAEFVIPKPINQEINDRTFTWYNFDIDHAYNINALVDHLDKDDIALQDFLFDANGYILISGDDWYDDEEPFDEFLWPRLEDFGYDWYGLSIEDEHVLKNKDTYAYYKGC